PALRRARRRRQPLVAQRLAGQDAGAGAVADAARTPRQLRRDAASRHGGALMSNDLVRYEARPPAVVLTINRTDRRNALSRGLIAAMLLPHLLRHVGERTARYLLLTGELIDAEEARRVGFINAVVPATELLDRAHAWGRSLAEGGPKALALTKDLLQRFS